MSGMNEAYRRLMEMERRMADLEHKNAKLQAFVTSLQAPIYQPPISNPDPD